MSLISRTVTVIQGHASNGDYLAASVHLELGDDNVVRYWDGDQWQPLNVVVNRVPVAPSVPFDIDELYRRHGVPIPPAVRAKPVDLGDDPDGDLDGYDGR